MAVEKMSFVNIAGNIDCLDSFVVDTIVPYEIQLVKALSVLDSVTELTLFDENSPYLEPLQIAECLIEDMNVKLNYDIQLKAEDVNIHEITKELHHIQDEFSSLKQEKEELMKKKVHKEQILKQILPIKDLDVKIDKLFHFDFMKFRFGKIPKDSFAKIIKYIEKLDVIVFEVFQEDNHVFCMYFMPETVQSEVDSLFASLYFERIRISDEIVGYPKQALHTLDNEILVFNSKLQIVEEKIDKYRVEKEERLYRLYITLLKLEEVFAVRKYAARTHDAFYLTGWIPKSNVKKFRKKLENNEKVSCVIEDDEDIKRIKPPTKLKNPAFFKPFEMLVSMYGTPSYNEIDPTIFVAITYMFLFGFMFGDVGQGLVIALLGYYFYKSKKVQGAKIGIYLGVCSMISGLFYGSVFGNEEMIKELLPFVPVYNPMHNIDSILVIAVGIGVFLIVFAMGLNIINSIRNKDIGKMLFDRNGIIGLFLYFAILILVLKNVIDMDISVLPVVVIIIASLIIIMFSHPLQNLLERREHIFPKDKVGFVVEGIFEIIETILAILSNSISFIRVGAFALNHVGFFMAFHMLSDLVGGAGSLSVMIVGNILIIALEGLIVFIQGLRLEYYELFSRFFEGDGTLFQPFEITKK